MRDQDIFQNKQPEYRDPEIFSTTVTKESSAPDAPPLKEGYSTPLVMDKGNGEMQAVAPKDPSSPSLISDPVDKPANASLLDYGLDTLSNIPSSAGKLVQDLVQPVLHPIDTAKGVSNLVQGAVDKVANDILRGFSSEPDAVSATDNQKAWEAAKNALAQRYGGVDNLLETIKNDPVGFASDLALLMTGSGAAVKGAGTVGKVAKIADAGNAIMKAGSAIDPVNVAAKAVSGTAGKVAPLAKQAIGAYTGIGPKGVNRALEGGDAFTDAMRGNTTGRDIVDTYKEAVDNLKEQKNIQYANDSAEVFANPIPMSMKPVEDAFHKRLIAWGVGKNKAGELTNQGTRVGPQALAELQTIADAITEWKYDTSLHNAQSINELKMRLNNDFNASSQVRQLTTGLKDDIDKILSSKVPGYKDMNTKYHDAMKQLDELHADLASVKDKASLNTTLNKLRSTNRENFEMRRDLMNELDAATGKDIGGMVAGYDAKNIIPKGLMGKLAAGSVGNLGATTALTGHPGLAALTIPALAASSPRLMGETLNGIGAAGRAIGKADPYLDWIGRDNISMLRSLAIQAGRDKNRRDQ